VTVNIFTILQNNLNAVFLNVPFINSEKVSSAVNIDHTKKCFKSAYYNDFWRIMGHWRL